MLDFDRIRSSASRLLFLKALSKKEILVPSYVKADGTYVPAHYKTVNYNPDHSAVLSGASSHSHKEALKQLSKDPAFKKMPHHHQSHLVMAHAQDIQTAASKAAQVSVWKKDLLAGKKPKAANQAAYDELNEQDPKKAAGILSQVVDAIGMDKYLELTGKQAPAPAPAGPSDEEKAVALEKLHEIGAKAPGMHYPYLAWKKLTADTKGWAALGDSVAKLQAVVDLAKQMQAEATAAAKVSTFTKKLALGKAPSPSELAAYAALDDAAKLKAVQQAAKKSGYKLSLEQINNLLDQAAGKAGVDVEAVEKPAPVATHFGHDHEGQTVSTGTSEASAKFKFEDGSWYSWLDGWKPIENVSWIAKLDKGQHPVLALPLKPVADPGADSADEDKLPHPDDSLWSHDPADAGFSGAPSLTFTAPDGGSYFIVGNDPMDGGGFQVGKIDPDNFEPEFKDYQSASRVQSYLQSIGIHPPETSTIEKLLDDGGFEASGPHEGDTKEGVGGLLVLKDGHWTLDTAGTVSFFNKHSISPASPLASAVMAAAQMMVSKPEFVTGNINNVKLVAKKSGYVPAQVDDLVSDLKKTWKAVRSTPVPEAPAEAAPSAPAAATPSLVYDHVLHFVDLKSSKFWHVTVDADNATATTKWGKIGTAGQSKTYQHASAKAAYDAAKEAAAAKLKKGYQTQQIQDSGVSSPAAAPASSFGSANIGKVFKAPAHVGMAYYHFSASDGWNFAFHESGPWSKVEPGTGLYNALESGKSAAGDKLQPTGEDVYGNSADDGSKEGDMKPGASGWLILKDGHWVKASLDEAIAKLCPVPESITSGPLKNTLLELAKSAGSKNIGQSYKKVATTKSGLPNVNLTIKPFGSFGNFGGKWVGYAAKDSDGKWTPVIGTAGKNVAAALNWLEHASAVEKAFLNNKKELPPSPFAGEAAQSPAPAPAPTPVTKVVTLLEPIDKWTKVGEQGGYNPGGTYKDPDGTEWYCKFPAGGAKVARNELLANKLYAAAGIAVPEVKLVTQGGKIGLASKIVQGAVKDKAALQGGKADGLLSGFVTDAWLANWDVVGNNPASGKGWDNIMFKDGKAVRIDPGGALLYGGAGGKKTAFGDQVIELDTMRDPNINARTAKVFGGISAADLKASAEKVLSIPDDVIEKLVKEVGPGDESEKAALAKTLLARKKHIAAKFPTVAAKVAKAAKAAAASNVAPGASASGAMKPEKVIVFKPDELSAPPDFLNWSGPGKHGPATLEAKNIANQEGVNKLLEVAKQGDPEKIKNVVFPLYDKDGAVVGSVSALDHPSQYVRGYAQQLINEIDFQLNPPKVFEFREDSELGGISAAFPTVKQITANLKRLGKYVLLGESSGFPETEVASYPKQTYKNGKITTQTFVAKSKAAWAKIPQLQRDAIKGYCGPKSGTINGSLWAGNISGQAASAAAGLHTHAYELPAGLILSRKISLSGKVLEELVGADLVHGNAKAGQQGMGGATGKVLQEPAISSTSISPDVWSGNVHLKLVVGPGVKGLYAGSGSGISPHAGEKEMLLPPNTRMLVRRVMKAPHAADADGFGQHTQYIVECLLLPTEGH